MGVIKGHKDRHGERIGAFVMEESDKDPAEVGLIVLEDDRGDAFPLRRVLASGVGELFESAYTDHDVADDIDGRLIGGAESLIGDDDIIGSAFAQVDPREGELFVRYGLGRPIFVGSDDLKPLRGEILAHIKGIDSRGGNGKGDELILFCRFPTLGRLGARRFFA